jgi:hypothetical protein
VVEGDQRDNPDTKAETRSPALLAGGGAPPP